jgi:hypothetical protein
MRDDEAPVRFMLYNVVTRRLLPQRWTADSVLRAEFQAENAGEGDDAGNLDYVLGWYFEADHLWVDWEGRVVGRSKDAPPLVIPQPILDPISADDVRSEAKRRIEGRYPLWNQLNVMAGGGEAMVEMRAFIDAVRDASNRIERLTPIPRDFNDDGYWTGESNG